jgi:dihydroxyacetone kinase
MRISSVSTLAIALSVFLFGCASTLIPYQSQERMSVKEASAVVEELTMMQPTDVKPVNFEIHENYILWGYGISGNSSTSRGIFKSTSQLTAQESSERIYFNSIENIEIYSKNGWYNVYIRCKYIEMSALYTQEINEAKRFVNALESLKLANKTNPTGQSRPTP